MTAIGGTLIAEAEAGAYLACYCPPCALANTRLPGSVVARRMEIAERMVLRYPERYQVRFYRDPVQALLASRLLATVHPETVACFFA